MVGKLIGIFGLAALLIGIVLFLWGPIMRIIDWMNYVIQDGTTMQMGVLCVSSGIVLIIVGGIIEAAHEDYKKSKAKLK